MSDHSPTPDPTPTTAAKLPKKQLRFQLDADSQQSSSSNSTNNDFSSHQLHLAASSLSDTFSIIQLMEYLGKTNDAISLLQYDMMGKLRGLLEECLLLLKNREEVVHDDGKREHDSNNGNEMAANQMDSEMTNTSSQLQEAVMERHTKAALHDIQKVTSAADILSEQTEDVAASTSSSSQTENVPSTQNTASLIDAEKLLNHLYMLLKAMLSYRHGEVSRAFFKDTNPEKLIDTLLSDSSLDRKIQMLQIVALLLESDAVKPHQWCNKEFVIELFDLVHQTAPRFGMQKAVIEVLSALIRRELLSKEPQFDWIQVVLKTHWHRFEELFSQVDEREDDSFMAASSFLEMLSFQVPLDSDSRKDVQRLNDRLKIDRWNVSRREQRKIHDEGQEQIKQITEKEKEVFALHGEQVHQNDKEEEMVLRMKENLSHQQRELKEIREREKRSRRVFFVSLGVSFVLSLGIVGSLFWLDQKHQHKQTAGSELTAE